MIVWVTGQRWLWGYREFGFGRRLDGTARCFGPVWRIEVRNTSLAIDVLIRLATLSRNSNKVL
jgi:hypothetical protein